MEQGRVTHTHTHPGQARPLCHSGASSCHTSQWALPEPFLRPSGHPLHARVFHSAGCSSSSRAAFSPVWISICSSVSGWAFILGPDSHTSLSQELLRSHEHSWLKEDGVLHTTEWSTAAHLSWAPSCDQGPAARSLVSLQALAGCPSCNGDTDPASITAEAALKRVSSRNGREELSKGLVQA